MAWVVGIGIFLFLLFAFPRQILSLIALVALAGVALWGYNYFQDREKERKRSRVVLTAAALGDTCDDPKFPIYVSFLNGSSSTIETISFSLQARRRGYSNSVYSDFLESDKIIEPGDKYSACWSVQDFMFRSGATKADIRNLEWEADLSSVRFAE